MRFWDASSLLTLAVQEPFTERMESLLRRDPDVVLWWGTPLDCAGALAAAQRQGRISASDLPKARAVLDHLRQRAFEIQALEEVRSRALRILAVHPLQSAQALELAAALIWCRERTHGVSFVSVEDSLRQAAALEGFRVLPYADEVHQPDDEADEPPPAATGGLRASGAGKRAEPAGGRPAGAAGPRGPSPGRRGRG